MGFSESTDNRLEVNELSSLSQSIFVAEFSTEVLVWRDVNRIYSWFCFACFSCPTSLPT